MNFRHFPKLACLLALSLLAPLPALAWGVEGHEIVAAVGLRELTPAARAKVAALLGSDTMMVLYANWADEVRDQRRETASWHFVDIPLDAPNYDPVRDCAMQACVVAQIQKDLQLLRDPRADKAGRTEALLFLIHFVSDVHQPLHAEDNLDKGGNQVRVQLGRERTNLHRVWDVDVVEPLGPDAGAVADSIERSLTDKQRQAWARGTAVRWANEAHAIAREHIYPPLMGAREIRLPRDYAWREAPLARLLLAQAGVRLGWLLNSTFK